VWWVFLQPLVTGGQSVMVEVGAANRFATQKQAFHAGIA
jgi:hypothetical protein